VSLRRLRPGELVALMGAICVIVSLALPWYEDPEGKLSAWSTFGPAVVLLMLGAAAGLLLALATVTERTTALPVAAAVWSTLFGLLAGIAAIVRVLERPQHATAPCAGAWLALAGALAILAGSWLSMRDERTGRYPMPEIEVRKPPPDRPGASG
jgi:prepilin signal peptidase PulO-like enzyme (type II secretory pathway)